MGWVIAVQFHIFKHRNNTHTILKPFSLSQTRHKEWNWAKRVERWTKILLGAEGEGLSAAPPEFYLERFQVGRGEGKEGKRRGERG